MGLHCMGGICTPERHSNRALANSLPRTTDSYCSAGRGHPETLESESNDWIPASKRYKEFRASSSCTHVGVFLIWKFAQNFTSSFSWALSAFRGSHSISSMNRMASPNMSRRFRKDEQVAEPSIT